MATEYTDALTLEGDDLWALAGARPDARAWIPKTIGATEDVWNKIRLWTIDEDLTGYLQNMIDSLDARGGEPFLPPGLYTIDGTLVIGDGTAGVLSTKLNVRLIGAGRGHSNTSATKSAVTIKRRGTSTDPLIRIDGPIVGVEISHLTLDCAGYAENGIEVWSASACKIHNVNILNNTREAIELRLRDQSDPVATGENHISFINIDTSQTRGSGISFGNTSGASYLDILRTRVNDIYAVVGAQGYGMQFNICDSIWADGFYCNSGMAGIIFNSILSSYPPYEMPMSLVLSNVYPFVSSAATFAVSNAEDDGTGKVKLTTATHTYTTGDYVSVDGVVGVPAMAIGR
jgi:hypothetical protein